MYGSRIVTTTKGSPNPAAAWLRRFEALDGPAYRRIAQALENAAAEGELQAGDQIPAQREVARRLGVDLTTVTRAYALARERGLIEGTTGRGTFVRSRTNEDEAGLVDLSMNLPPPPAGLNLAALLRETTGAILARTDPAILLAYHPGAGSLAQRTAGAAWLAPVLGEVDPERVIVASGAQTALSALLDHLTRPGDTILAEAFAYPGLLATAARRGLRVVACPLDDQGLELEALAQRVAEHRPRLICCTPTFQNPTAATMDLARRRAVVDIARAAGVTIVEDDAYGLLPAAPLPALASLWPEGVFHVATTAKALSPGLRLAYVVAPPGQAEGLAATLHAIAQMPAPLMAAVVTSWIREGLAGRVLAGVREEAVARRALAAEWLPTAVGGAETLHVWLPDAVAGAAARERGLALVAAEAFRAPGTVGEGLRISLGAAGKRGTLVRGLRALGELQAS
ncbi:MULTISPECIES: PLP-dependent aminotransferase family protein [unclassified Caulobacter]|uniref:aminotransferase-like domain-containing protein n=1 Tax=unclassified Caulobacter TaxID=2648921 RepID=UPI0006F42F0E|nr:MULTISPECIES: PLP-dependent aminotransferase family protein [unclassified Caulobacter]KQV54829.1 GntR family transcriptional regulator [Caulobacter sp. Root342]KQV68564.1 GntR family transcriptional regulator [Caulobacter sp. Root343]